MFVNKNKIKVGLFVATFSFLMANAFPAETSTEKTIIASQEDKKQNLSKEQYEKIAKILINLKAENFTEAFGSFVGKTGSVLGNVLNEVSTIGISVFLGALTSALSCTTSLDENINSSDFRKLIICMSLIQSTGGLPHRDIEIEFQRIAIKNYAIWFLSSIAYYLVFKIVFDHILAPKDKEQDKDQAVSKLEKFMAKWVTIRSKAPEKLKEIFEPIYAKYLLGNKKLNLTKEKAEDVLEQALVACLAVTE